MKKTEPNFKASLRCEVLQTMMRRFSKIDIATIGVIAQVQSLSRTLSARFNNDLAEYGLTEGRFYVLAYLFSQETAGRKDVSPSDIAENLDVTRGTITGLLDGLEREGYVERCSDSHDRRALTIQMTERARHFLDNFMPKSALSLSREMPLDEEQKRTLTEWLLQIEQAVIVSDA